MYSLAKYIVSEFSDKSPHGITPLKLQKLLYYIYVWDKVSNKNLVDTKFVKWKHGPVNKEIYHSYKHFGNSKITKTQFDHDITIDDTKFITFIIENYIEFSAFTLSTMTHLDEPWKKAELNSELDEESIKKFYSSLNFSKNFPISESNKFYPVETDMHYSFELDFGNKNFVATKPFKSYSDYLTIKAKIKEDMKQIFNWLHDEF